MTMDIDLIQVSGLRDANERHQFAIGLRSLVAVYYYFLARVRQLCHHDRAPAYLIVLAMGSYLTCATLTAADDTPKPILTVPSSLLRGVQQAQVTSDGKYCVVITSHGTAGEPSRLRVFELATGAITAERQFSFALVDGRPRSRSITPDGRLYCWVDQNRWVVVASVHTGQEIHRADLTELEVETTGAPMKSGWISDDGSFLICAVSSEREPFRLIRLDFMPSPRVAASMVASGDNAMSPVTFSISGDRESGRMIGLLQKKRGLGLAVWDMGFQVLSKAPSTVTGVEVWEWQANASPLIPVSIAGKPMFFTLKRDHLEMLPASQQTWPTIPRIAAFGAVSPDGQYAACATCLRRGSELHSTWLTIWSVRKGMIVRDIPCNNDSLAIPGFDVSGRYLTVISMGNVTVWDFADLVRAEADSTPSLSQ